MPSTACTASKTHLETDLDLLRAFTKIKDGADWRLWAKLFIFCLERENEIVGEIGNH